MICTKDTVTTGDWDPKTTYLFCHEHQSTFGADDLNQCHAVRMAAALSPHGMTVEDFAGVTVEDHDAMEAKAEVAVSVRGRPPGLTDTEWAIAQLFALVVGERTGQNGLALLDNAAAEYTAERRKEGGDS